MTDLYLPVIGGGPSAPTIPMVKRWLALLELVRKYSTRSHQLTHDERLANAAMIHALDMAERNYFNHVTPEGLTANERAKAAGFPLGLGKGNNIESIAAHDSGPTAKPEVVHAALMRSDAHRQHLVGDGWFGTLDRIGVGYAYNEASDHKYYYVVLIAKEGGPRDDQ